MGKPYEIRLIDGIEHKLCKGPCHIEGVWLSISRFSARGDKTGRLRGSCRQCEYWYRYHKTSPKLDTLHGYIKLDDSIKNYMMEIERRLGRLEAIRRTGISKTTWYRLLNNKHRQTKINRINLAKIIVTVNELRASNEVRHRKSIQRGAYLRNEAELTPKLPNDFYVSITDYELEYRRKRRR